VEVVAEGRDAWIGWRSNSIFSRFVVPWIVKSSVAVTCRLRPASDE
jgi:hypothetical protein